jgi:hypothetical protein
MSRSLFVLFFWPLCCLSFDLRILVTRLVSSNSFYRIEKNYNDYCKIRFSGNFLFELSHNETRTPLKTGGEFRCSGMVGCTLTVKHALFSYQYNYVSRTLLVYIVSLRYVFMYYRYTAFSSIFIMSRV